MAKTCAVNIINSIKAKCFIELKDSQMELFAPDSNTDTNYIK